MCLLTVVALISKPAGVDPCRGAQVTRPLGSPNGFIRLGGGLLSASFRPVDSHSVWWHGTLRPKSAAATSERVCQELAAPCHLTDLVSSHFPLPCAPATLASFLFFLVTLYRISPLTLSPCSRVLLPQVLADTLSVHPFLAHLPSALAPSPE